MSSGKNAMIGSMGRVVNDGGAQMTALGPMNALVGRSDPAMNMPRALSQFGASKNDEYNHNGAMAIVNSNATVTNPYGYNRHSTPQHWHSQGQIMFLSTAENSNAKYNRVYQVCGLSMLNWRLKNDLAFASRFKYHTAQQLTQNWAFMGVETAEDIFDSDHSQAQFQTLVIHGRVQMPNYWVALESRKKTGSAVQEGDQLYFLLKRFKRPMMINKKRSAAAMHGAQQTSQNPQPWKATADEFYWQYVPYVSTNNCRPSMMLYSEPDHKDRNGDLVKEGYVGAQIFIGSVQQVYASKRMTALDFRIKARDSISPKYDNDAYLHDFVILPQVQIMVKQ